MIYVVPHVQNKRMKSYHRSIRSELHCLRDGSATAESVDCESNVGCIAATEEKCTSDAVARGLRSFGGSNMLTFEVLGVERW